MTAEFDDLVAGLDTPESEVPVDDLRRFPAAGVVLIDGEAFDYWTTDDGEMVCLPHEP